MEKHSILVKQLKFIKPIRCDNCGETLVWSGDLRMASRARKFLSLSVTIAAAKPSKSLKRSQTRCRYCSK